VALRFPIKKLAALSGLMAAGFYLLISGQAIATQRAFIMLSVMFVAVLLGRSAISMRNLAVAAIIVLLIAPRAVLTPSFQMSFLAVMGLIAGYELVASWQTALRDRLSSRSMVLRIGSKLVLGVLALSATTIIASAFTALPAAYHFNRFAVWSLPANILAMPFVTALVMPGAVASVALMPLGLEYWPLQVMKLGLEAVEAVAAMISSWPGSAKVVGAMQPVLAFFAMIALCGLCLWRGALRWVWAASAIGLACLAIWFGPRPDIFIERTATTIAARLDNGLLVPVYDRRGRFAVDRWLLTDGDAADLKIAGKRPGWACEADVCRAQVRGKNVIWLGRKAKVPSDCSSADIVVSANPLRRSCGYPKAGKVHIDRFDVWRNGSHALYIEPDGQVLTHSARELSGARPWIHTPVSRRKVLVKAPPPWKPMPEKTTDQ
jgi:competence protein ComEC